MIQLIIQIAWPKIQQWYIRKPSCQAVFFGYCSDWLGKTTVIPSDLAQSRLHDVYHLNVANMSRIILQYQQFPRCICLPILQYCTFALVHLGVLSALLCGPLWRASWRCALRLRGPVAREPKMFCKVSSISPSNQQVPRSVDQAQNIRPLCCMVGPACQSQNTCHIWSRHPPWMIPCPSLFSMWCITKPGQAFNRLGFWANSASLRPSGCWAALSLPVSFLQRSGASTVLHLAQGNWQTSTCDQPWSTMILLHRTVKSNQNQTKTPPSLCWFCRTALSQAVYTNALPNCQIPLEKIQCKFNKKSMYRQWKRNDKVTELPKTVEAFKLCQCNKFSGNLTKSRMFAKKSRNIQ